MNLKFLRSVNYSMVCSEKKLKIWLFILTETQALLSVYQNRSHHTKMFFVQHSEIKNLIAQPDNNINSACG